MSKAFWLAMVVFCFFLIAALTFMVPTGPTVMKTISAGKLLYFFEFATMADWGYLIIAAVAIVIGI